MTDPRRYRVAMTKTARIEIVLPPKEKTAFASACKANHSTMSREIRGFMREYSKNRKP